MSRLDVHICQQQPNKGFLLRGSISKCLHVDRVLDRLSSSSSSSLLLLLLLSLLLLLLFILLSETGSHLGEIKDQLSEENFPKSRKEGLLEQTSKLWCHRGSQAPKNGKCA